MISLHNYRINILFWLRGPLWGNFCHDPDTKIEIVVGKVVLRLQRDTASTRISA